ncbi:MAG: outer membrane protein transport protein [Acidobacteria bacterium]|nr:outer membrane protein transport protein [Acidobacteriota bacterium]
MKRIGTSRVVLLAGLAALCAGAALAQGPGSLFPNYPFSSFRFNFINPGARATGMGQAFIALGDDATGSETNPAGLTALVKPQLFAEGRWVVNRFQTLRMVVGEASYDRFSEGTFSPTFLSVVYPLRQWAFGAYRQELANYEVSPSQGLVVIHDTRFRLTNQPLQVTPFDTRIRIKTVNYGFSLARRWGERVNLGVSFRATRFTARSVETQSTQYLSPMVATIDGSTTAILHHLDGDDWAFSWVAGAIVKPRDNLRVGAVYRSGSDHPMHMVYNENLMSVPGNVPLAVTDTEFKLRVPSRFGVGLAYLPTEHVTFTADLIQIRYGELTPSFVHLIQREFRDDYAFENGTSVRLGAEYTVFWGRVPVSIRVGFYTDPDNTLHYVGDRHGNDGIWALAGVYFPISQIIYNFPAAQRAVFPERGTDCHLTFGTGFTFRNHLQVDWAADVARDRAYLVVSALYNF